MEELADNFRTLGCHQNRSQSRGDLQESLDNASCLGTSCYMGSFARQRCLRMYSQQSTADQWTEKLTSVAAEIHRIHQIREFAAITLELQTRYQVYGA